MPARRRQPRHGQHGAADRDGGARQIDPDLGVVPDGLLRLLQPAARRLQPLGVQLAGPARRFVPLPLARTHDDLGQAVRRVPALPVAPGLLDLRVDEVPPFPADVGRRRGDRALRRGQDAQLTVPLQQRFSWHGRIVPRGVGKTSGSPGSICPMRTAGHRDQAAGVRKTPKGNQP